MFPRKRTMASNSTVRDGGVNDSGGVEILCDEMVDFETFSGAFFILIFIFSFTCNCLLVFVLVIYEDLRHVTNIFILNLACSDLIFTVTLPFSAVYQLHQWVFGEFACKLMIAAYIVGLYSSIILLTAMTVDRFRTVVLHNWPANSARRQRCAMVSCAAAWVLSIAASVRDAIKVTVEDWDGIYRCEDPSDGHDDKLGYYLQVSLLFFLPFAIIVFCYSAILKTVLQASNRRKHRTVVVVLCIVAAFFVCWGPHNILILIGSLYEPKSCSAMERLFNAYYICRILAYSHCCMNPLLYMLSHKLQRHLLDLLRCEKVRRKNRGRDTSVVQNVAFTAQNSAVMLELNTT
ncbi:chemokine XC receptor 1-like [Cottoperca gobio]|uniref:Chemokine XC receptor 1-like n=1 Tax=Cottoperca gobio TaxID=56716 RepID=A0A6J2RJ55_COTGO|nr:chemokine XC receptor 1-like [Cottoperca gobio]